MTDTITLPRSVVEQALEALNATMATHGKREWIEAAKQQADATLRSALEQPQDHTEQNLNMVPAGWKLVPVDPTTKMIDAARSQSSFPAGVWRAMLAAAPQPPVVEQPQVEAATGKDYLQVPAGFVLLQTKNGKPVYSACLDGGRFHGWLMWKHPDGQWVSKRKLEAWEIMQAEDQRDYGIVQGD